VRAGEEGQGYLAERPLPSIDSGATRDEGSRFDATNGSSTANYYLRTGFALSTAAGTARTSIDQFVNSSVGCSGRPFTPFGTWSISP
jgi:hypothetical protein